MIVVTGGAGFIGSALIWKLNNCGYKDIVVVDSFANQNKWKNLIKRQFIDIIDKKDFLRIIKTSDLLNTCKFFYHLGACSSTTERNFDYLLDNNTRYSKELFNVCCEKNIPFIYASSAATYGLGALGYSDELSLLNLLEPINPYGFSKKIFDSWVLTRVNKPCFWMGLKFFNVYGPNEYHKGDMMSLVAKAVPQIKETKQLRLFKSHKAGVGHGEQKRDFVYVKDVVDILVDLLLVYNSKKRDLLSGIYNLGTGRARTFSDLGRAVFKALNLPCKFEWIDMPLSIRNQYQYFTEARLDNFKKARGDSYTFTSLEDGVKDYVSSYLTQDNHCL